MRVYDGENLKDTDPKAKSVQEYRDAAGVDEGMTGVCTRFAFKVLSQTFNYDTEEVAADPVHLMYILEQAIKREQFPKETEKQLSRLHQVRAGAALCRVHRPRDPEGLSRILLANTARTCSTATSPMPMPGSRTRTTRIPTPARSSTARCWTQELSQDREAGRHRQPEGLPQRGGEVHAARARAQQRPQPVLDELREAARGHREAHVRPGRGPAAGDQLRLQAGQRHREDSTTNSSSGWSTRGYTERQVRRLVDWYMRVNKAG